MPYGIYIAGTRLPVPPSTITTTIPNKNETYDLIDEGEINIIKKEGLREFSFSIELPAYDRPYVTNDGSYKPPIHYLKLFAYLKSEKLPFMLDVYRELPDGTATYNTGELVSLEDYTVTEDAENGFDVTVELNFKRYQNYSTATVVQDEDGLHYTVIRGTDKRVNRVVDVKEGDTLVTIAMRELGKADQATLDYLYAINKDAIDAACAENGVTPPQVFEGMSIRLTDDSYGNIDEYTAGTGETVSAGNLTAADVETITEEGITVTQYESIMQSIMGMQNRLNDINNVFIYNYVDDNMPEVFRPIVRYLVHQEWLKGSELGLGLTYDMLRLLGVLSRTGAFGPDCPTPEDSKGW